MIFFSEQDIQEQVGAQAFERGRAYQRKGQVKQLSVFPEEGLIQAAVQGSRSRPYKVSIEIFNHNHGVLIEGECSCPMEYNCKHVAAVLLEFSNNPLYSNNPPYTMNSTIGNHWLKEISKDKPLKKSPFEQWLNSLDKTLQPHLSPLSQSHGDYDLLYLLSLQTYRKPVVILNLGVARHLKKGGHGIHKRFSVSSEGHYRALLPIDHNILHQLEVIKRAQGIITRELYQDNYELSTDKETEMFKAILQTNRCYWQTSANQPPLTLGEAKQGILRWTVNDAGEQKLACEVDGEKTMILPLFPLWYLKIHTGVCGPLETGIDPKLFEALLSAPPLLPQEVGKMQKIIEKRFSQQRHSIPLPHQFKTIEIKNCEPKPKLLLFGLEVEPYIFANKSKDFVIPLGRLSFKYDDLEIQLDTLENTQVLDRKNNVLKSVSRQFAQEEVCIKVLLQKGAELFSKKTSYLPLKSQDFLIGEIGKESSQETFLYRAVPELKQLGWEIIIDESFPSQYLIAVDEWYSEIEETNEYNWFNLELGFVVNNQKINILPLLVEWIRQDPKMFSEQSLQALGKKHFIATLPDGQKVNIPIQRIKGILTTLTELYDEKSLKETGQLAISRFRATQVLELEKAMQLTQLRWLGAERLQKLREKWTHFKSIQSVRLPKTFTGTLRDYQKQGVNWLGFLREYELGGILSDDMGLGKTVQALAHVLVEKEAKRLQKPCLIIAPTSLMSNWREEAKQFTPSLEVVVLQGQLRKQLFTHLTEADIILTTYALIVRDKEVLLENEYGLIILDEAQYIKNAHTHAYQILQQLRTKHRLCLTGTPLENHLGELWSLFNFLSPGLLGSSQQFSQLFRIPIEKHGNLYRQQSLNQRLSPYLLRRTKKDVLQELPSKTEIIQNIELSEAERDLYESIRLSMESKLKKVIKERGLASSQIFILDALLKLRQACCDPRLLRLEQAKRVKTSTKLSFLIQMLKESIAEGRKILVFSSFTSMLTLIEEDCKKQQIPYVKLTGSTVDRETPIRKFQEGNVPLFLISLKAGGTGLNLTAADTVIHYDPWWNPAAEAQATDRAHRIGQTKPIFVYKLVTVGTVEEKILTMQQKKRALLEGLFEGQKTTQMSLTKEDLKFLFQPLEAL